MYMHTHTSTYFFIPDILCSVSGRFLHCSQAQDLQQVVLHHVSTRFGDKKEWLEPKLSVTLTRKELFFACTYVRIQHVRRE